MQSAGACFSYVLPSCLSSSPLHYRSFSRQQRASTASPPPPAYRGDKQAILAEHDPRCHCASTYLRVIQLDRSVKDDRRLDRRIPLDSMMAATASYSRPLDAAMAGSAGPSSARPLASSVSPTKTAISASAAAAAASASRKAAAAGVQEPHRASKASSSPSKKKIQIKKTRLPEVGPTIQDVENGVVHITGRLLGQGGFARVYQVQGADGRPMAFKAIMKEALLHQRKNRQKVCTPLREPQLVIRHADIASFLHLRFLLRS